MFQRGPDGAEVKSVPVAGDLGLVLVEEKIPGRKADFASILAWRIYENGEGLGELVRRYEWGRD